MSQIECKICSKKFGQITSTHLRMHNYIPDQYKKEFKIDKLVSEEVGNKISKSKIGHIVTENTREKLRIANIGKIRSDESKLKQSISINNFWNRNSERKKELSLKYSGKNGSFYGKHHTEENKMKMGGAVIDYSGKNNPMYGKTHSEETRDKMKIKRQGKNHPIQKGKTYEEIYGFDRSMKETEKRSGENNGMYGKRHTEESLNKMYISKMGITKDEYFENLPEKDKYYAQVLKITKSQPTYLLENYDKPRGRNGVKGAYQLDHIIPKSYGFKNNIDPEIIGDVSNLQFIPWEENMKKFDHIKEKR